MTTFARITTHHDLVLAALTPCAQALYRFCLRSAPAGKVFDLDIQEFAAMARHRWRGIRSYSDRQIRRALYELTAGIDGWRPLEIVRKYGARYLQIVAHHPDPIGDDWPKMSKSRPEMSKKTPSNPHSAVESIYDLHTVKPCIQSVVEDKSSLIDTSPPSAESPPGPDLGPEDRGLLDQVASELGCDLNASVRANILAAGAERVGAALGALREARAGRGLRNPLGFLLAALKGGWRPSESIAERPCYPQGFLTWYHEAIAAGIVLPLRPELLGCDRYGDPLVRVPGRGSLPYELVCWRLVADS